MAPGFPYKLGKRPPVHDSRDLLYADLRAPLALGASLPVVPKVFGHGNDFSNWFMLGNGPAEPTDEFPANWTAAKEGAGDCAWAAPSHTTMQINHEAKRPVPRFTGKVVIEQYAEYSGYNPETGENDNGSVIKEVLSWRQSKGLRDADGGVHKIGPYVSLEVGNIEHLLEALYLFESVELGIEVPESAQTQFAEGKIWSVVPGSPIVGGHAIELIGHPAPDLFAVVTWGKKQIVSEEFLKKFLDESWAFITTERYNQVTGKTYEGYQSADMEKFINLLAQSTNRPA